MTTSLAVADGQVNWRHGGQRPTAKFAFGGKKRCQESKGVGNECHEGKKRGRILFSTSTKEVRPLRPLFLSKDLLETSNYE